MIKIQTQLTITTSALLVF